MPRKEDDRLLSGAGNFTADLTLPGEVHACVVRSPHAHARIRGIDAASVLAMPGVLAVLTGRDAAADGLQPIPFRPISPNPHEVPLKGSFPPFPLLSADKGALRRRSGRHGRRGDARHRAGRGRARRDRLRASRHGGRYLHRQRVWRSCRRRRRFCERHAHRAPANAAESRHRCAARAARDHRGL